MAYTVLARRYRSATFDEVIGQEHIAQTLKRAIETGRIAHAYLFCGTRGTGKTSTARILAKCLNCEAFDKPTPIPCNQCTSCLSIARGDDIDVIEIDAASHTGVDSVRDIISNSQFSPSRSRFKVYIIDEVHALSRNAFNALLKTLEEPPSHVKFILATTEPEKVLPTILSRCQRYDFRNIPAREIAAHLKHICLQEKIEADDDALLLVAKSGAGSMRDALSLLDRLLGSGESKLTAETIEQMLGLPRTMLLHDLADAIGRGDVGATLTQADAILSGGMSADTLIASLSEYFRNLLIVRACGENSDLVEAPGIAPADLAAQAKRFDPMILSADVTILEELRRTMRQAQTGRALLDATFARLALAEQFAPIADLVSQIDNGSDGASPEKKNGDVTRPVVTQAAARVTAPPPIPPAQTQSETPQADDDDDLPRPGKVWEQQSGLSLKELLAQQKSHAASPAVKSAIAVEAAIPQEASSPAISTDLEAMWWSACQSLDRPLAAALATAKLVDVLDDLAIVRFPARSATWVEYAGAKARKQALIAALSQAAGRPVGVRLELETEPDQAAGDAAPTPPTQRQPTPKPAVANEPPAPAIPAPATITLTDALRAEVESDPLVNAALKMFGGQLRSVEVDS
jgi:DNA polymerase III subunit gamma/tau